MSNKNKTIEVLILAAGASRRLGQPKQLIKHYDVSLIKSVTMEAINAEVGNVTVVTGFEHQKIALEIHDLNVEIFFNPEWEEGQGASIRNGINNILITKPDTSAVLLAVVDQPFVNAAHLRKLVEAYSPGKQLIIASAYSNTFGVPILIDTFYFDMLQTLKDDEGGKKIFINYLKYIVEIPFQDGAIDIDEKEDLKYLT